MKTSKSGAFWALLIFAIFTLISSCDGLYHPKMDKKAGNATVPTFPHFSLLQRSLLRTLQSKKPDLFKGLSIDMILQNMPTPQADYPRHLYIDEVFIEYRQLLTQAIKIPKTERLPEIDWSEFYDFCIWVYCFQFQLTLRTGNSKLIGTTQTSSRTEVNTSTIVNTFSVPHVEYNSPDMWFYAEFDGYNNGMNGYHIYVDNLTIITSARYQYEEGVGIIITSLDLDLKVGNYTTVTDTFYWIDPDGYVEKEGPYVADLTSYTMDDWSRNKEEYTAEILRQLNCLLTKQRAFPSKCEPSTEERYNEYYHFLVTQLIQTIGLGALLD